MQLEPTKDGGKPEDARVCHHMLLARCGIRLYSPYARRILPLLLSENCLPRIQTQLVRPPMDRRNISNQGDVERVFDESTTVVKLKDDDDGETFVCDEEPHMLDPLLGYGYYPMILGERMHDGKYEIVRKLGWGGNSSVWLAKTCDESHRPRYVAIKVLNVNATAGILKKFLDEYKFLKLVTSTNMEHPGYKHCIILRDSFLARSKHGPHICMVTDALGMELSDLQRSQPRRVFTVSVVKRIIKQTLLALDYLHRECRLVHTDVKPGNTLISLGGGDEAIQAYLEENPSLTYEPRIEPDLSPDPIITVKTQPLPSFQLDPDLSNIEIRLIDYGHAVSADANLDGEAQPVLLRAPEVILGHTWSTPVDIWSVGCVAFEYLVDTALFQLHESSSVTFTQVHLVRIMEHIGPFPLDFLNACARRAEFFDEQGSLLRVKQLVPRSIEECLMVYCKLDEKDVAPAAAFIRRCLTIDPTMRPTAATLLEDEWLRY